jgi:cobalt-zinc-cadmium efflux system membrane fusion protein
MKNTILSLLAASLLAGLIGGCAKPEEERPTPAPSVSGTTVSFPGEKDPLGVRTSVVASQADQVFTVPGRLTWDEDRTTRVYAPYAGRIERLRVAVGQTVKRGEPLADVASADIGQAQADRQKAEADLRLARAAAERAKELSEAGVIAGKDLQQAQAEFARANAEEARTKARLAQYGVASRGVTQTMTLNAPLSGVVVERNGNPGAEVRADVQGPALFTISDPTSLWAVLDVDETRLGAFSAGQEVQLRAAAWPDKTFEARVMTIGETVDPTARTVKVRARVANPEHKLKAEMFVTASVHVPSSLPMVPADAVFQYGEKTYVFVQMGPGRYERRSIDVRSAGPQTWLALNGVKAGERVVVGGGLYLNQMVEASRRSDASPQLN